MVVVDTSAWIEWLLNSPTGGKVGPELPAARDWLVPTIVQLELVKWLVREVGEEKADAVIAFTETCIVVGLDTRLALAAADIGARHKLSIADAIVDATAQARAADLLTCDAHFTSLPGVRLITRT